MKTHLAHRFLPVGLLAAVLVGVAFSSAASSDTVSAPSITAQPEIGVVHSAGDSVAFTATGAGSPAPTVQWQEAANRTGPWSNVSGATNTTLSVTASGSNLGHAYRAVFTNAAGTAVSRPAKLVSTENWMHDLGDDIADVPLTELTIPGTHDMGTYGIPDRSDASRDLQASDLGCEIANTVCDSFARAQDARDATQQLDDGIRYFDLRVCGSNDPLPLTPYPPDFVAISGDPVTCHGLVAAPVGQILFQVADWAGKHPDEVVILDFNHLYQVDPVTLANKIAAAFATPGGSLLLPPQYCTPGDTNSGTCAGNLTLGSLWSDPSPHGNVIVNIENDGAPGKSACFDLCGTDFARSYSIQRTLSSPTDLSFFDDHQDLWGRATGEINQEFCTRSGAFTSCFSNDTDRFVTLARAVGAINTRQTFAEPSPAGPPYMFEHFFVQFLQTTPDTKYIVENPSDSLLDLALDSNPVVGPGLLGCGDWAIYDCFAQYRPENLNILAINFYERTVDSSGQPFTFVPEVIRFDEYARTAPVVSVSPAAQPAATGWYNAASLGGQGKTLGVHAAAGDYRWPTGITQLGCTDGGSAVNLGNAQNTDSSESADFLLADGVHAIACTGTDGANKGLHGVGNSGAGPGSNATASLKVDTTPPVVTCPTSTALLLNQPTSSLTGTVTDATSGVASSSVSSPISTASVGSFTTKLTASDNAGNTASVTCSFTVSYRIVFRYDTTKLASIGSAVPIKVELDDYYSRDVSDKTIVVTAKTVTNTASAATFVPTPAGGSNQGFVFYVSPTKGYQYDVKTTGYKPGTYTLDFVAGRDPIVHHAPFGVH